MIPIFLYALVTQNLNVNIFKYPPVQMSEYQVAYHFFYLKRM